MKTADKSLHNSQSSPVSPDPRPFGDEDPRICIGGRVLESRYFLSPLAGYTHLAYRQVVRELGGLGLATTDLVLANQLSHNSRKSMELIATNDADHPLSVQIYGGVNEELVRAARWLEDHGYEGIDLNMGCPMAKVTGNGGGARLMCDVDNASRAVATVTEAVAIPVTVKMRLGWDREHITAPTLARAFEQLGVAAITIHGRTRQQGFHGNVQLEGIRETVAAVERIPVIGNGDVRTVEGAIAMRRSTGCAAVAIGRGALMDPWIFQRLHRVNSGDTSEWEPSAEVQIEFLERHFRLMQEQHGEPMSCLMFRKFAAWNGARLGIPEDLEDRLRRFESAAEFDGIVEQIRRRHGERENPRPTAEVRVPNGPVERW
jgi:tRNA-dihydrouridine synthase B